MSRQRFHLVLIAVGMLPGCTTAWFDAYQDYQNRKEAMSPTKRAAQVATTVGRQHAVRTLVLAGRGFRNHHTDWRKEVGKQFTTADQLLAPFDIRFEIVALRVWDHDGGTSLAHDLVALQAEAPGDEVDFVVGMVAALPAFTDSMSQLGLAAVLGKHAVTREIDDRYELEAFQKILNYSRRSDVDELYLQRRKHKKGIILVHEWGHTLGLAHVADAERWFLRPVYGPKMAEFSPMNRKLVHLALANRVGPSGDDTRWRAAVHALLASRSDLDAEQRSVLAMLAGTTAKTAVAPQPWQGIAARDRDTLNRIIDLLNAGHFEKAWPELAELRERYRDDPEIQSIACDTALRASVDHSVEICTVARMVATRDPRPALAVFNRAGAAADLGLLREACERAPAAGGLSNAWWANLARTAIHAGILSCAETAIARVPSAQAEGLRRDLDQARNLFGLPSAALPASEDFDLRTRVRAVEQHLNAGELKKAEALAATIVERWRTPGALSLLAEVHGRKQHYDKARKLCRAARGALATDARAGYILAVLEARRGRIAEAERFLREVIAHAPRHEPSWRLLVHSGRRSELKALRAVYRRRLNQEASF